MIDIDIVRQDRNDFLRIKSLLDAAIKDSNPLVMMDSLYSLEQLWAGCISHRNNALVFNSAEEIGNLLKNKRVCLSNMRATGAITPDMLVEMAGILGVGQVREAFVWATDRHIKPPPALTHKEEAALFLARLREGEACAPDRVWNLQVGDMMKRGNYHVACLAIEFAATRADGASMLSDMGFFNGLEEYCPARRTRTNYHKLPEPLLVTIHNHQQLIVDSATAARARSTGKALTCPPWVLREFGVHGMNDMAQKLAALKYNITEACAPISLSHHAAVIRNTKDGHLVIGTLRQIGMTTVAERTADWIIERRCGLDIQPRRHSTESVYELLNLCAYVVEHEGFGEKEADDIFIVAAPQLAGSSWRHCGDVADMLVELDKHLSTTQATEASQNKYQSLLNTMAPLLQASPKGMRHLEDIDPELSSRVKISTGYKRAQLGADLSL